MGAVMAWSKNTTTKHTCGGPVFGRKTPGCPRCDELLAGAAPVAWGTPRMSEADFTARKGCTCHLRDCRYGTGCRIATGL